MNYSINDEDGKTLHGNEKNVGAAPPCLPIFIRDAALSKT